MSDSVITNMLYFWFICVVKKILIVIVGGYFNIFVVFINISVTYPIVVIWEYEIICDWACENRPSEHKKIAVFFTIAFIWQL